MTTLEPSQDSWCLTMAKKIISWLVLFSANRQDLLVVWVVWVQSEGQSALIRRGLYYPAG